VVFSTAQCQKRDKTNPSYVLVNSYRPFISLHVEFILAIFSNHNEDQRSSRSTMMQFMIAYFCTKNACELMYCHCADAWCLWRKVLCEQQICLFGISIIQDRLTKHRMVWRLLKDYFNVHRCFFYTLIDSNVDHCLININIVAK